jgi:hypothetical protein
MLTARPHMIRQQPPVNPPATIWHSRPSQRRMVSPQITTMLPSGQWRALSPASWDWHGPVAGTGAGVGSDDTLGHGQEQPPVRIDAGHP